mgnify:CR=1 FL=1
MIWKITILLWVMYLVTSYLVRCTMTTDEKRKIAFGVKAKLTPLRIVMVLLFLASLAMSIVTIVWLLFWVL